jgi:prepilin-type N-terminal cleavage/methylation domain-containing protein
MLRKRGQSGFTLIELLIVIAVIGILASIAVPMYRIQTVKAKLAELTNSMGYLSSALATYYNEEGGWPPTDLTTAAAIRSTLGVSVPIGINYIGLFSISGGSGLITCQATNTGDVTVDGQTFTLTPSVTSDGAITWQWGGTIPYSYRPAGPKF